ncbi:hypothetical protein [Streptomyces pacificus]|uniref:Uncharacterized protein n=1 Tax=Streptomyces pacificus TaxID=2705029 RepID=A0A6A0AMK9_9ACTN|nr:hypothetical protein [Streptomyces pacificus]GFH34052.1 hypothetical protein SCWH03_02580 [Streptomyces pacificus]
MKTALDVLYVLICLGVLFTGIAVMLHLRGEHEHPADCRPCRPLNKLSRWAPKGRSTT